MYEDIPAQIKDDSVQRLPLSTVRSFEVDIVIRRNTLDYSTIVSTKRSSPVMQLAPGLLCTWSSACCLVFTVEVAKS